MKQKVSGAKVHISEEAAGSSHEDVPGGGGSCPSQNRQNPLRAAGNRLRTANGKEAHQEEQLGGTTLTAVAG